MLRKTLSILTWLGTPFFYAPVIILMLKLNQSLAIKSIIALIIVEALCAAIKVAFPTQRPVPAKKANNLYQKYEASSFPSAHSARIAALATMCLPLLGNWSTISAALVAAVAYSRVYLKKHYQIDALGGLLIGTVVGLILLNLG